MTDDDFGTPVQDLPNQSVQQGFDEAEEHRETRLLRILDCADKIRGQLELSPNHAFGLRGQRCLAPPIVDAMVEGEESKKLINWVNFDPYQPAVVTLYCTPVPKRKERLLSVVKYRLSNPEEAVFGLIPGDSTITPVEQAVGALFATNGYPSCALLQWLPTSIGHRDNWDIDREIPLLGAKLTRGLFYAAVRHVWPSHINTFCDHLRRFKDPWERIEAALAWRTNAEQGGNTGSESPFSDQVFLQWFALATAPEHVAAERKNFAELWHGAKRYASADSTKLN